MSDARREKALFATAAFLFMMLLALYELGGLVAMWVACAVLALIGAIVALGYFLNVTEDHQRERRMVRLTKPPEATVTRAEN